MSPGDLVAYRIDTSDRIIWVNDEWDRFARRNDGDAFVAAEVLGRPLWDFVCDATTRHIYRELLDRVRAGDSVRFPFRCDAPAERRLLDMRIVPTGNEAEFQVRPISLDARPPQTLIAVHPQRSEDVLRSCGWCRRFEIGDSWLEVEDAVRELRLFESAKPPLVSHGMCPECFDRMTQTIQTAC